MSTDIRAEISHNNQYYISKERYYELLHFCRQYKDYKIQYNEALSASRQLLNNEIKHMSDSSEVERKASKMYEYSRKIDIIDENLTLAGGDIHYYLFLAVTRGLSFNNLKTSMNMPCGKNYFYKRYRKFFWLLDQARG